jgi:4-hydroxythreonine-4-phosphate dehydrogenase
MPLPVVLVTAGDPNGVGPEIALKAAASPMVTRRCRPRIVGCPEVLGKAAKALGMKLPRVIPPDGVPLPSLEPGRCRAQAGRMAYRTLLKAHELIKDGKAQAMATGPINKEALKKAGYARIAHTEILAHLNHRPDPLTLFVAGRMWIAFFSRHLSLKEAVRTVKKKALVRFAHRLRGELETLGRNSPRLAMAALNPHAGEGGLLGLEETREILPAVQQLVQEGVDIKGPIPADSVFHLCREGAFDCVVSLYHDQGHIAAKSHAFHDTVSVTLGLPYIRTSVDHGTAYDLAWKGQARADSLRAAILLAARLIKIVT